MIRRCAGCHCVPRQDDALETIQIEGLTFAGCRACVARSRGEPEPGPVLWPHGRDYPFPVCGICRQALKDGDRPQAMRLHADDVAGLDVQPGCYASCQECVDFFRPIIHKRLVGAGVRINLETVQGNWLL